MLARCRRRGRGLGIRCAVHRVALEPPRLEAVSELVSTITSDYPVYWVEFGSGRRALASCSRAMKLRLWYAPPGGALRRPAEPGPACGGQFAQKDGKRVVGYIERMGQLHEIDFGAARARPAGVLPPPLRATERLVWDGRAGRWKLERMGRGWGRRRSRSRRSRSR
jgi:hypothetical protein